MNNKYIKNNLILLVIFIIASCVVNISSYAENKDTIDADLREWAKKEFHIGNKLFKEQKYEGAIKCYENITKSFPYHMQSYINAGIAFRELGQREKAMRVYEVALKFNNKDHRIHLGIGETFYEMRKYKESLKWVEEGLKLNNHSSDLYYMKGAILAAQGNHKESLINDDKALQLDPTDYMTYKNRFCSLMKLNKYDEAVKTCDNAIKYGSNKPDIYVVYTNKAKALYELKRYPEALESVNVAIRINHNHQEAQRIKRLIGVKLQSI